MEAAIIRNARPAATPAIKGTVRRTPKLAPEASASSVLGPGVNVVATARATMDRSASTIAVWPGRYTAFMTAQRSALRSKPMPGASGIATRPSTTGQSSAKPPKGAKTCG